MFRLFLLTCCLMFPALVGCDDDDEDGVSFQVAPDDEFPIPGLGLRNRVYVSVRHVGYQRDADPEDEDPSIGMMRIYDDESSLADDPRMFEGDTLRFTYDDSTFSLEVVEFEFEDEDLRQGKATLSVERL